MYNYCHRHKKRMFCCLKNMVNMSPVFTGFVSGVPVPRSSVSSWTPRITRRASALSFSSNSGCVGSGESSFSWSCVRHGVSFFFVFEFQVPPQSQIFEDWVWSQSILHPAGQQLLHPGFLVCNWRGGMQIEKLPTPPVDLHDLRTAELNSSWTAAEHGLPISWSEFSDWCDERRE